MKVTYVYTGDYLIFTSKKKKKNFSTPRSETSLLRETIIINKRFEKRIGRRAEDKSCVKIGYKPPILSIYTFVCTGWFTNTISQCATLYFILRSKIKNWQSSYQFFITSADEEKKESHYSFLRSNSPLPDSRTSTRIFTL